MKKEHNLSLIIDMIGSVEASFFIGATLFLESVTKKALFINLNKIILFLSIVYLLISIISLYKNYKNYDLLS